MGEGEEVGDRLGDLRQMVLFQVQHLKWVYKVYLFSNNIIIKYTQQCTTHPFVF